MGQPVVHFEILGKDAAKLQAFYSQLFGWDIDADNPFNYGMVAREANLGEDGIGIGGGIAAAPKGGPTYVTFYVQVGDVEDALTEAERLGGERVTGPESVGDDLTIGLFRDPEGQIIGVMTPR